MKQRNIIRIGLVLGIACLWLNNAIADSASSYEAQLIGENCLACHQPGKKNAMPALDRLSADDIADKLKRFKGGALTSTIMGRHAKAYQDDQIDAIANFLAQRPHE